MRSCPNTRRELTALKTGSYLGGDAQALVKQMDFQFSDGAEGSAFIVI